MTIASLIEEVNFLLSLTEKLKINIESIEIKDEFGNNVIIE